MILEIAVQKGQTTKAAVDPSEPSATKTKKVKAASLAVVADSGDKGQPRASLRLVVSGLPVSLKKKAFKEVLRALLPPGCTKKLDLEVADKVRHHHSYTTILSNNIAY
jgi:hypothetical protein